MYLEWNYISFTATNVLFWTGFSFEQNQKKLSLCFYIYEIVYFAFMNIL